MRPPNASAAYFFVDLQALSIEDRQKVIDDAVIGGQDYGVIVVEEHVNGPARQPIYGVYYDTEATAPSNSMETKWSAAKVAFGLGDGVDGPAVEEALREQAKATADEAAEAARSAEEKEVGAIAPQEAVTKPNKLK